LLLAGAAACGGDELDRLAEGERGRVAAVFAGGELRLESGLEVRLAGVDVPGSGEPGGREAQALLARRLEERDAALLYGGERRDGYGRAVAHVRSTGDRRWAQGALLDAGLARVRTTAADRALASQMLRREARARAAGRGLWSSPAWRVRLPGEVRPGFMIVEGRIGGVERTGSGAAFTVGAERDGLQVGLTRRARADLAAAGVPIEAAEGRLVRLRGVARPTGTGHRIELDHPEQLEVLRSARGVK
jgi:endonuclease YncB( thermonuclease family)